MCIATGETPEPQHRIRHNPEITPDIPQGACISRPSALLAAEDNDS